MKTTKKHQFILWLLMLAFNFTAHAEITRAQLDEAKKACHVKYDPQKDKNQEDAELNCITGFLSRHSGTSEDLGKNKDKKEEFSKSRDKLNSVWRTLPAEVRAFLEQEQNEWWHKRDDDCTHKATTQESDNPVVQEAIKLTCQTEATNKRTEELQKQKAKSLVFVVKKAKDELNTFWNTMPRQRQLDLENDQTEWHKYRDTECDLKATTEISGNSVEKDIIKLNCIAEMTNERTKKLKGR